MSNNLLPLLYFFPPSLSPSHTLSFSQHGASINVTDLWQFTPLQEAASKGRADVCSLLLAHGANPGIANCHGKTAFNLAPSEEFRKKLECKRERERERGGEERERDV